MKISKIHIVRIGQTCSIMVWMTYSWLIQNSSKKSSLFKISWLRSQSSLWDEVMTSCVLPLPHPLPKNKFNAFSINIISRVPLARAKLDGHGKRGRSSKTAHFQPRQKIKIMNAHVGVLVDSNGFSNWFWVSLFAF